MLINGVKYACASCIRGHRASNCFHSERELNVVRRKGRPTTQCTKCQELRRTRKAHVKCLCAEMKAGELGHMSTISSAPESPTKVRRTDNGRQAKASSIESLLNPCHCKNDEFCTCCKPKFSEFLTRSYPPRVVEQSVRSLSQTLGRPSVSMPVTPAVTTHAASQAATCPSGPNAPCCKTEPSTRTGSLVKDYGVVRAPSLPMPYQQQPQQQLLQQPPQQQRRISNPWAGAPPRRPAGNIQLLPPHPQQPMSARVPTQHYERPAEHAQRPSCACGCDCSKRLDMLIQAIETRIGLGRPLAPAIRSPSRERADSEWVHSLLTPVQSAERTHPMTARPLLPVITPASRHGRTPSLGSMMSGTASAPQTSRRPSFGPLPTPTPAPVVSRIRSSSNSSTVSGSTIRTMPHLGSASPEKEQSPKGGFAAGVIPPIASSTWQQPSLPSTCLGPQDAQQVLPMKSCCDTKDAAKSCCSAKEPQEAARSGENPSAKGCCEGKPPPSADALSGRPAGGGKCASGCGKSCACCERAGWVPGNASNAKLDDDGALACSCGCHMPFGECKDCIKDNCMSLLFKSSSM